MRPRTTAIVCAVIPAVALTVGLIFANRIEPKILGFPFIMAWIVVWGFLSTAFMWFAYWSEHA